MSEIKEKINEIMIASCEFANSHSIKTSNLNYQMLENGLMEMKSFLESNYIPKEEHEKQLKAAEYWLREENILLREIIQEYRNKANDKTPF